MEYKIPVLIPENIDWQWIEAGSRRRIILQIDQDNRIGFFEKKSKILKFYFLFCHLFQLFKCR